MAVVKWVFEDLSDASTYTFEINASEGGTPTYRKNLHVVSAIAPGGRTIVSEGADSVETQRFSGTILNEEQYNAMLEWFNKRHQIQFTDDLYRTWVIYITGFTATREHRQSHPWYHKYTVDYIIVDHPD